VLCFFFIILQSTSLRIRLCSRPSLASFPCPAQLCVAYIMDKWGQPGIFSHMSMTQSTNGKKNLQRKSKVLHIVRLTTQSMVSVYYSHPSLPRYMWYVTRCHSSSCCSELQCTHAQLSPFYELSTLDIMDMRKDTRPFAFFVQPKTAWAWE